MMFKLRRSVDGKTFVLKNIPDDITFNDFQKLIESMVNIPVDQQELLIGHPPVPLTSTTSLVSGSVIVVSPKADLRMIRKVIDADNSCLFNSIAYCLGKGASGHGPALRRIIKETILSDPSTYNSTFLGRPVSEYVSWIMEPTSWGGEIELSILASYFNIEIMVLQIQTVTSYCYNNETNCRYRIFLMYDGIHYDAIAQINVATKIEKAQFETNESLNDVSNRALELIAAAHNAREFTDLQNFTLQCLVCGSGLTGQADGKLSLYL